MPTNTEPILPRRGWYDRGREMIGWGPSQATLDYENAKRNTYERTFGIIIP